MRALRIVVGILAFIQGSWMLFDGSRALIVGDYVTPKSGTYAGQLGPWSKVVQSVGIPPRSTAMKIAFVIFGALWITGLVGLLTSRRWSRRLLAVMAIASLWYLPVGTVASSLILAALALERLAARDRRVVAPS